MLKSCLTLRQRKIQIKKKQTWILCLHRKGGESEMSDFHLMAEEEVIFIPTNSPRKYHDVSDDCEQCDNVESD